MGMYNKHNKKCNCPHCRGGHTPSFHNDFHELNGANVDVNNEMHSIQIERLDPEDLVDQYVEAVLQCDTSEEVDEVMREFFDEVFIYAMQETYMSEIEGKIKALRLLEQEFEEEDDE